MRNPLDEENFRFSSFVRPYDELKGDFNPSWDTWVSHKRKTTWKTIYELQKNMELTTMAIVKSISVNVSIHSTCDAEAARKKIQIHFHSYVVWELFAIFHASLSRLKKATSENFLVFSTQ